jgi:nucleoside-diphosphate-sugar epimerase
MAEVAITGATGFVGGHLLARLVDSQWVPVPLVRKPSGLANEQVIGPLEHAQDALIAPVEAMIHCAARTHVLKESEADPLAAYRAINVGGTRAALAIAQRAGAKKFVFLSSVKAMGEETEPGSPFSESTPPQPEDAYGVTKLEAEQLVQDFCQAHGMAWTIVRPPLVYGPGVKANFQALARLARSGLPLPLGKTRNARSLIYVGNLADFLVYALESDAARNRLFLLDDGRPFSTSTLLQAMAKAEGRQARLFPVPQALVRSLARVTGKAGLYRRLFGSLEINSSAARAAGWQPPFTAAEGFQRTLAR